MEIKNSNFDYYEITPAFIEVDLQDIDETFAKIRQEMFLIGDKTYRDHQKILQMILDRGSKLLLHEFKMLHEISAPF